MNALNEIKMNTEINTEQTEINIIASAVVVGGEQEEFTLNKKPKKVVIKTGGEKKIVTKKEETKEPEPNQKVSATDDDEEELRESDRLLEIAMERSKAIRLKKALGSQAMTILDKVKETLTLDINHNRKAIATLRAENKDFEDQLEVINSINPETDDVVLFLQENYKAYIDEVIDTQVSKEVAAKVAPVKASSGGATRVRAVINTEDRLNAIPDRLVLRASGKHKVDKERVVVLDIIYRAETQTFYRYGKGEKTEYKILQDANREWCFARGIPKDRLENGWEMFKAIDKQGTLKPQPIQHIHTAEGNWTTDMAPETLARFVDKKFKF